MRASRTCRRATMRPRASARRRPPREPQRRAVMAIIGTFTQNGNGLTGSVKTLTLNAKVRFVALEKDSDKAPDYRVIAGTNVELGAAWKRTSKEGRPYHSVKLDDSS